MSDFRINSGVPILPAGMTNEEFYKEQAEYWREIAGQEKARIEALEVALRKIRSGTEDIYFPLRAMPRETMRQIANAALEAKHD